MEKALTQEIEKEIEWLVNLGISYGEAGIKLIFHDNQIRFIRTFVDVQKKPEGVFHDNT